MWRHRERQSLTALPLCLHEWWHEAADCKMRISIFCPDVEGYVENPAAFLPAKPTCLNCAAHKVYWNSRWLRGLLVDHVHTVEIPLFNAYCQSCHETISYWPEFVLPYQCEPLETHEQAVVEHLEGCSVRESAAKIGYDPRTLSRWLRRIFDQARNLLDKAVSRVLCLIGTGELPIPSTPNEAAAFLFAWMYRLAEVTRFPRRRRLMGLCNLIAKGDWDLWGAPLGKARSRMDFAPAPG